MAERIVIAGSIAQKPGFGGHAWVFMQYLLGLRRLGWDVVFLDRLEPAMCVDEQGHACTAERSVNLRYLEQLMASFGLGDAFALYWDGGRQTIGRSHQEVLEHTRSSACLLNVMGFLDHEEVLGAAPRRVFLDIDPGFGQMWCELGLYDPFQGHDEFVTVGQNLGRSDCLVPTCDRQWITTLPPVVLEQWPAQAAASTNTITTVASWRGAYGPIEFDGTTYGLRVHEFRKFVELPLRSDQRFELALNIQEADGDDRKNLLEHGWSLTDPRKCAGDVWTYQSYVQRSLAEFSVAKNMYVDTRSGWFSDRSACYLASGRPVIAQDTGFSASLPVGSGLLTFSTPQQACDATEAMASDIDRHRRHARAIAEELFDSDKVLTTLLDKLAVA